MSNANELIFVNNILSFKITIRKAAKQLGLRRDDLIKRIKVMIKEDEENLEKLNLIISINKIIFGDLKIKEAAKKFGISEKELDKKITKILENNNEKKIRYEQLKNKK